MKTNKARIAAPTPDKWSKEGAELMAPFIKSGNDINIFRTLTNHPLLMKKFMTFGSYILGAATISARLREVVILRTAYLCDAEYEWGQHVRVGRDAGLEDDVIRAIKDDPTSSLFSELERLSIQASDALFADKFIPDDLWASLGEHLGDQEKMDLVFTIGQYTMVAMALNSFGVQLEEGAAGWEI